MTGSSGGRGPRRDEEGRERGRTSSREDQRRERGCVGVGRERGNEKARKERTANESEAEQLPVHTDRLASHRSFSTV